MNRRVLLAFGGAAVLAATVILYIALTTTDDVAARSGGTGDPVARPTPAGDPARPALPRATGSDVPTQVADTTDAPREYMIDGVKVRDHRKGDHAPVDLPRNIHPPGTRKVASTLTHDLSQKLQAALAECATKIPPEARGIKPRLEGTVFIAIKDARAQITDATVQLRGVQGETVAAAKQCMEQKSVGIGTPAPGEADLERYSISLSFALPK
jgi:hypothetical protein